MLLNQIVSEFCNSSRVNSPRTVALRDFLAFRLVRNLITYAVTPISLVKLLYSVASITFVMSSAFWAHATFKLTWIIGTSSICFNSFSTSLRCVFVTGLTELGHWSGPLLRNVGPFHHLVSLARSVGLHPPETVVCWVT